MLARLQRLYELRLVVSEMTFNPEAVFNPEGAAVIGCAIGFIIFLGWLERRRERREWRRLLLRHGVNPDTFEPIRRD